MTHTRGLARSSFQPAIPRHERNVPRSAIASANGEPIVSLPFVASPPARSIARSANPRASITPPASCFAVIAVAIRATVNVGSPMVSSSSANSVEALPPHGGGP